MRLVSVIMLCLALLRITGLDLAMMQSYAWATMIYDRAEQGMTSAISSTFSGDSPCQHCLSVANEADERQEEPAQRALSLDQLKLTAPSHNSSRPFTLESVTQLSNFPPCLQLSALFDLGVESPPPQLG